MTIISQIFHGGSDGKASVYNVGDLGSIPGSGRFPGEGNGNPLQYYCLENPTDRGAWWATVHGVAKSRTRLRDFTIYISFSSDDHYIYYCEQESLTRNGVPIMVNKRVQNAVFGCNLKNNRIISVHFQGKPFNITVIQVYAPTSNADETEVEWVFEDLQDL